jgi:pimeloyl-ACP methyl ester carboxylesterase
LSVDRPPTGHHLLLRNRRVHYLDWGGDATQAIVLLHGSGLNAHTWRPVCEGLRADYRCLAPDLRGHGDSEWANDLDYAPATHAADVAAFIGAIGLQLPVLVGMSLGGLIAVRVAEEIECRALVVVDTGPEIEPSGRQQLIDFFAGPGELDSVDAFVERALAFNPRRDPRLLRESLLRNLVRLPDGRWTWKYDRRHFGRVSEEARKRNRAQIWSRIDDIRCPTLVVRGEHSPVLAHRVAVELAASFRNGRLVEIPGAGHNVQGDQPAAFQEALRRFLDSAAVRGPCTDGT